MLPLKNKCAAFLSSPVFEKGVTRLVGLIWWGIFGLVALVGVTYGLAFSLSIQTWLFGMVILGTVYFSLSSLCFKQITPVLSWFWIPLFPLLGLLTQLGPFLFKQIFLGVMLGVWLASWGDWTKKLWQGFSKEQLEWKNFTQREAWFAACLAPQAHLAFFKAFKEAPFSLNFTMRSGWWFKRGGERELPFKRPCLTDRYPKDHAIEFAYLNRCCEALDCLFELEETPFKDVTGFSTWLSNSLAKPSFAFHEFFWRWASPELIDRITKKCPDLPALNLLIYLERRCEPMGMAFLYSFMKAHYQAELRVVSQILERLIEQEKITLTHLDDYLDRHQKGLESDHLDDLMVVHYMTGKPWLPFLIQEESPYVRYLKALSEKMHLAQSLPSPISNAKSKRL